MEKYPSEVFFSFYCPRLVRVWLPFKVATIPSQRANSSGSTCQIPAFSGCPPNSARVVTISRVKIRGFNLQTSHLQLRSNRHWPSNLRSRTSTSSCIRTMLHENWPAGRSRSGQSHCCVGSLTLSMLHAALKKCKFWDAGCVARGVVAAFFAVATQA